MKKILSEVDIINWWLNKFFDTDLEDVKKKHSWEDGNYEHSWKFYKTYAVTKEQYKEFEQYFYKEIPKILKISQKYWKRTCWSAYLNCSPSVIDEQ